MLRRNSIEGKDAKVRSCDALPGDVDYVENYVDGDDCDGDNDAGVDNDDSA